MVLFTGPLLYNNQPRRCIGLVWHWIHTFFLYLLAETGSPVSQLTPIGSRTAVARSGAHRGRQLQAELNRLTVQEYPSLRARGSRGEMLHCFSTARCSKALMDRSYMFQEPRCLVCA